VNLAIPIYLFDHRARFLAELCLVWAIRARAIGRNKEFRRSGLADAVEDALCQIGAIEYEEEDRRYSRVVVMLVHTRFLFCYSS
jgi:hypothetical protein